MNTKEELRSFTIGARKHFEKETVEISIGDQTKAFEVRQPTIGQRGVINNKAMQFNDGEMEFDMFGFLICAVVELTYVPGTDERVFSEEDYESLKSLPAGGWFDKLTSTASTLCNVKSDEVKKPSVLTEEK